MEKNRAIFLDRDGTLIKAIIKIKDKKKFKLRPPFNIHEFKIFEDIIILNKYSNRYLLIIISNQPDLKNLKQSKIFHYYINQNIKKKIKIKEFFYCLCFEKEISCKCYKPKTLMLNKAVMKYNISIKNSYLIGDTWRDIKMANNFNIKSILINRGYYKYLKKDFNLNKARPDFRIRNFNQLRMIIK